MIKYVSCTTHIPSFRVLMRHKRASVLDMRITSSDSTGSSRSGRPDADIGQVLDRNPSLHFALLRLQLIELIRTCMASPDGDITPAVDFASTLLAPRAPTNPEFLEDLERTMALLIFPPDDLAPPLAALLDPELRKLVANRVNEAILINQGSRREARIRKMIRLRAWSEIRAKEAKKDYTDTLPFGLESDAEVANGVHDVIMQDTENGDDHESL